MNITPRSDALKDLKPMDPAHFTGNAGAHDLIQAARETLSAFAAMVRFEAGVRNHWHSHAGGQLLHVVEGEGWVQARGGPPQRIRPGDTILSNQNEEHWHGAGRRGPMAHLAVAIGETRWLEASPAPPE